MLYTLIAIIVGLIALYVAYQAVRVLALKSWFLGFFRGLFGLGLLVLAIGIGVVAYDVYSYKQILQEQPVATISFEKIENQYFDVRLVDKDGKETRYSLRGDQWQLDARIVKWKGYIATLGIKPAYRLERLSGRYFDIEQETTAKRTAYAIHQSLYGLDVWQLLNKHPQWVPAIDTVYGSATYLPMIDKALFEVTLSHTGLLARPLNDAAREAVSLIN
ncbi:hypothetical protein [Cellvibrio japonicus]|uniref:Putative membrane protein n=1 Tax=Cellvibrio japonicus (strain Ueda107) TaxID=498211 RepID=B3PHP4_CELJU|nr:hypothetical protein [Cellvibrio japonicus]ACE85865.1 putative membrane protein [Cellvibrio japonicus Ueda107]QEI12512.1 cation/multidrug efflux pump [Cellvibrio japonicus]QEI16086.1 cation/multidrug efflux pump [Cellvibrio japonicus]QEI19664.1 cation/multidrug efflux pump [Cellvibrio japonicus]